MTMVTISPSGREVSPARSSCRSSILVLLKFRFVAAAIPPESLLLIFFLERNPLIEKDGSRKGSRGPINHLGATRVRPRLAGLWPPGGSPPVLLPPNIFHKIQNNSSLIFTAFGVAYNRYLKRAPFLGQNSSCRHSPSSCKPYKIRDKRHKYCTVKCNNSP